MNRAVDYGGSVRDGIMTVPRYKYGLMRIFWPSDAPRDSIPGVLVGWRNSELDVLVVGVLQGVEVRKTYLPLGMKGWMNRLTDVVIRLAMLNMLCECAHFSEAALTR